ncbi:hypothetical protein ACFFQW_35105 [Umezawaea endophytica]|uniref:Uncharacterized protein n=1 Tax=Umezawaea endophytica TaxID=1654476 RepID=A0A9X2VVJ2_9PSEU|nr:hypothetical protein [Umezawaea endophytica]MCS7483730.1 hypothetical protein [Umezawaea endophytica]
MTVLGAQSHREVLRALRLPKTSSMQVKRPAKPLGERGRDLALLSTSTA